MDKRDAGNVSKRRRECVKCGKRFNTHETVEHAEIMVVKKDKRRERFDIEKLKNGVQKACEKRPIKTDRIDKMLINIQDKIRKKGNEVSTDFIGELVSNELKKIDKVAYIRFASVYKDFTDLSDFKEAIASLRPREPEKTSKSSQGFKKEIRGILK